MQSNSESHPQTSKRRSTRIVQAVPLMLTGVDALGRPFQERTSTQSINCHGARYQSKHYVLKNMWVTIEVPHPQSGQPPRRVRGRVTWIQRPRTVRELFQVAVELEVPGNIWGLAFHPPDWIPFPENASLEIPASETSFMPEPDQQSESSLGETEPPDNLRVFPLTSEDPAAELARQMARLVMEAKQQIHEAAREAASQAVARETRDLLSSVETQLRGAAERAIREALSAQADRLSQEAVEQVRQSGEEQLAGLLDRWSAGVRERFAQMQEEQSSAFRLQVEKQLLVATDEAARRSAAIASDAARAEESLQRVKHELDQSATAAGQRIQALLEAKAQDILARGKELERSIEELRQKARADAISAHETWRARLDAGRESAATAWQESLAGSIEEAARRASERFTQQASAAGTQFDQEIPLRISAQRQALDELANQAQASLDTLRGRLQKESARTEELQQQLQQSSRRLEEQSSKLDEFTRAAQMQLEERIATLLEESTADLRNQAEAAGADMAHRLQPAMNAVGQEILQRLAHDFENELTPRMARAKELVRELASGIAASDAALREQELRVRTNSETAERELTERLREIVGRTEHEVDDAGRTSTAKWLAELETKATETTHTTFEGLMKAAAWYEKKIQTQMQAALEKGMETSEAQLREKAGEISGIFAGELDHYSRSFVELVQGQVNESLGETLEKARADAQGLAEGALSQFQDSLHQTLARESERFSGSLGGSLEDFRTRTDSIRTHAESTLQADIARSSAEFKRSLEQELSNGVSRARRDLEDQLAPLIEHLKTQRKDQESEFSRTLDQLGDAAAGNFRGRLENTANSSLATSAATLSQQTQAAADRLTELSEQKLRQAAAEVFAEVGEALRQRLLEISVSVIPQTTSTESNQAGKAASGGSGA